MKTKPLFDFNRAEIQLVVDAMRLQIKGLSGFDKKLMETDYFKVINQGTMAELDGMGMEHITRSLRRKALMFTALYGSTKHIETKKIMYDLAAVVASRRIKFQQQHNPLNKKEASAGTANAS
ncbi:hypothetical protein [Bacillus suaedae]|uniref:Uncharacterized protein n=1 Tax=Halalkalibacter suaedae TaxID=2822140 RepID=A0A941AMX9_9BACI|nr:hypothetical protein [Bacillus suaedae]MBP3950306.1 hypothetical protein [Bacillus suaedae]